jgi:hypothetical protein
MTGIFRYETVGIVVKRYGRFSEFMSHPCAQFGGGIPGVEGAFTDRCQDGRRKTSVDV